MLSIRLFIAVAVGTIIMLVPMLIQSKWYRIKLWKSIPIALLLSLTGTISTYIWHFIETGNFNGVSFFGAVFIVPIVFCLVAKLLNVRYCLLMDLCAPAECAMLVIMKTLCFINGCCYGIGLYTSKLGGLVRFPSQIVELLNALILVVLLLYLSKQVKNRGTIYYWYMVLYGSSRFVLNFLRDTKPVFLFFGFGSVWALVALFIGVSALIYNKKIKQK